MVPDRQYCFVHGLSREAMSGEPTATPDRYDVLCYSDGTNRVVPAGDGQPIAEAHVTESRRRQLIASLVTGFIAAVAGVVGGLFLLDGLVVSLGVGLALGAVAALARSQYWSHDDFVPELVVADAAERVVRDYVDEFDPAEVTDPFGGDD